MKDKKETSQKQMKANKANARKSTGAKTKAGKKAVSKNAVKHGILSKELVLQGEDEDEFNDLSESLIKQFSPVGVIENMMVEKIAVSYWRLARVLKAEKGQIQSIQSNFGTRKLIKRTKEASEKIDSKFIQKKDLREIKTSSVGLNLLINILKQAKEEAELIGYISSDLRLKIKGVFGGDNLMMSQFSKDFTPSELNKAEIACVVSSMIEAGINNPNEAGEDKVSNTDNMKEGMLKILDEEIKSLEGLEEIALRVETDQDEAKWQSAFVPLGDNSDKLLRYETAIEKQLYRAISELERLQRMRAGEKTFPPVKLQVVRD